MSKRTPAVILCLVLLAVSSSAAAAPQYTDWGAPVNLGSVINGAAADTGPALSKDGLSLYFTSNRGGGFGLNDIWVSQRESEDDAWGTPVNLGSTVNTAAIDAVPCFSRDGHWMFFNSNRSGGYGQNDLWASYRGDVHDDFAWETPANLGPGVNSEAIEQGATYFENSHSGVPLLYFGSDRAGGVGNNDTYVSALQSDGTWGDAELVEELSSAMFDGRPAITHSGLEMFIFSARPGGQGGVDIWVSTRATDTDDWGTPVNLGSTVNTAQADQQPFISSDGETLYFSSGRAGGEGGADLYMTTRTKA